MRFYGTEVIERILVHDDDNIEDMHYIELVKPADESVFYVGCCCDDDWGWAFRVLDNSSYEEIKYVVMEAASVCMDMEELTETLDEVFLDEFRDMIIGIDEFQCDGDCANCDMK